MRVLLHPQQEEKGTVERVAEMKAANVKIKNIRITTAASNHDRVDPF